MIVLDIFILIICYIYFSSWKQIFRCSRQMRSNYIILCWNFVGTRSMRETDVSGMGSISFLSDEEPVYANSIIILHSMNSFLKRPVGMRLKNREESRKIARCIRHAISVMKIALRLVCITARNQNHVSGTQSWTLGRKLP